MAFDYKKEYKEFYLPKAKPEIVTVPKMNFLAVRGSGDPNKEGGEYKASIGLLYGIAFTIKMSKKGDHQIEGYFDYVVPPLEGFWWQDCSVRRTSNRSQQRLLCEEVLSLTPKNAKGGRFSFGIDYSCKDSFQWISVIRLPDFVTKEDFDWAVEEASRKKATDFSKVEFLTYEEGLCVQCMHIGAYDDEPATVEGMHRFMEEQGYALDITDQRYHHEIYLSDARRVAPERLKTVIRHPIRRV